MIFIDTETTSLYGMIASIQYAYDDKEPQIYLPWDNPIRDTIELIEEFTNHDGLIFFNAVFDWFMIYKLWTTFSMFPDPDEYPLDHIDELGILESKSRDYPFCLKPKSVLDIMLFARKTEYQKCMARRDIVIKKVPTVLAESLCEELEKRVILDDVLFAKRKDKYAPKWDIQNIDGTNDFKNIILRFHASSSLKALAAAALKERDDSILFYVDISLPKKAFSQEPGYAPFATSIGRPGAWNWSWPELIKVHHDHWKYNERARQYAMADVTYTRKLYHYFGCPEFNDDDSVLACAAAVIRWRGYQVDIEGIKELKKKATELSNKVPKAPRQVRTYVMAGLSDVEKLALTQGDSIVTSTKRVVLEKLANDPLWEGSEVSKRSKEVLEARGAKKEIELYDKLLQASRLHTSFNIIGTLSSRMSGTDKLNTQAIRKTKDVRCMFPLAWPGCTLTGGDFKSFEVVLADAVYNDPELRKELTTIDPCPFCETKGCKECEGTGKYPRSIHAIFGTFVYPPMTYLDVLLTKGTSDDKYTRSKSGLFAMLYGGEGFTLQSRLGVAIEDADKAYQMFSSRFRKVGLERLKIHHMFCTMVQKDEHGRITWNEPAEYIDSIFGFRRWFTVENSIAKTLYQLAEKPPKNWLQSKIKCTRRDREQYVSGAIRSALFASAFTLQAANKRAAGNHVIQSSGAQLTKMLQRRIWDLQPSGISEWVVQPMNIHDELMVPAKPNYVTKIRKVVNDFINEKKSVVPLLAIDWSDELRSWADK